MKQLTQKLKTGVMKVIDVPPPLAGPGMVLVRSRYSLISPGTEGGTVRAARKNLVGKAMERPRQAVKVVEVARNQGARQAWRSAMNKLDSHSPLGYSCAGEVVKTGPGVEKLAVGDLAACGGIQAAHAELVAVPVNLCVRLDPDADLSKAAYNTLGAIALQGVRQADLRIGETCAVIGLGLIGQLTCLILRASGVRVAGIDVDEAAVETASKHTADMALMRGTPGMAEAMDEFSRGLGFDAVIIAASGESRDPVNLAGRLARKKGRVVIVGNVPTGFDREPHYYRKELDLRMSCSYGPGRYDPQYEERGIDYPPGYVRWTENRNMQAFQDLVGSEKIDPSVLTSHVFDLDDAPKAYDMLLGGSEPFMGVLIRYARDSRPMRYKADIRPAERAGTVTMGLIGAGNYARSFLLPNFRGKKGVVFKGVMSSSGTSSRTAAERFGFEFCTSREEDIFGNEEINAVVIATRHDTHADYVIKGLSSGKHVFVEKPLCLTEDELRRITGEYVNKGDGRLLMVGFNRRFSTLTEEAMARIGRPPMSMLYRVNAGALPADSWIHDPLVGGGRIIGEAGHFIDYLTFLNGSLPLTVYARAMRDPLGLNDTVVITLTFQNGSVGSISYCANGAVDLGKEYVEIHSSGTTAVIRDFKDLEFHGGRRSFSRKIRTRDKGRARMAEAFLEAIREGGPSPTPFEEVRAVTQASLKAVESMQSGQAIALD